MRKPAEASQEEKEENPRSRSARLRAIRKLWYVFFNDKVNNFDECIYESDGLREVIGEETGWLIL